MIRVLEKDVADKIAAGEVVDRPLSIVKELVENSIDAGASAITIEIRKGGKEYIRVTDDGCGIHEHEVETAFLRHATSKISTAADIDAIETLGFRGEALASIAAVSRTEIITKTADSKTGVRMVIEGSEIRTKEATGCPDGTTIVVYDLFYNTPARQKFMKSDAAESSAVIEFASQIALAYPHLKIRMMNNGTLLFSTNGKGDRYKNIMTVFDKSIGEDLIPVHATAGYLEIEGYVSNPGKSRATRKHQIFFVNGRVIESKVIQRGIAQAYADKLFEGRHPIIFLFLKVRPDTLDVNIHPNKKEIRFDDEKFIIEAIRSAIREALLSKESIPQVKQADIFKMKPQQKPAVEKPVSTTVTAGSAVREQTKAYGASAPVTDLSKVAKPVNEEQVDVKSLLSTLRQQKNAQNDIAQKNNATKLTAPQPATADKDAPANSKTGDTLPAKPAPNAASDCTNNSSAVTPASTLQTPAPETKPKTPAPFDFDDLKITGSIFGTYITAVDENCFYLIDQHAAHERIFYEKLLKQFRDSEKHSQPIMLPIVINSTLSSEKKEEGWKNALNKMGFLVEDFGPKTFIVKEIPMFMGLEEAGDFLNDFMDNAHDGIYIENTPAVEKIIMKSCKSAVKAHDYLKNDEIDQLIKDLKNCENPFSCPHGRPTFIKMTQYEIEKMFKRV